MAAAVIATTLTALPCRAEPPSATRAVVIRITRCDKLFATSAARSMLVLELGAELRPDEEAATARPLMVMSCRQADQIVVVEVRFPGQSRPARRLLQLRGTAKQGRARYVALSVAEFVHELEASPPPQPVTPPRREPAPPEPKTEPAPHEALWLIGVGGALVGGAPGALGWGLDLDLQQRPLPWLSWGVGLRWTRQRRATAPGDLVGQRVEATLRLGAGLALGERLYGELGLGARLGRLGLQAQPDGGEATFGWGGPCAQLRATWLALEPVGLALHGELGVVTWGGEVTAGAEVIGINGPWWSLGATAVVAF